MLNEIIAYAQQQDIPPVGYQQKPVRYRIQLTASGSCVGVYDRAEEPGAPRGPRVPVPAKDNRTSGVVPILLVDKGSYVLGPYGPLGTTIGERAIIEHRAFVDLIDECAQHTGDPVVAAVATFLHDVLPQGIPFPDDFAYQDWIGFAVEGDDPTTRETVRSFWGHKILDLTKAPQVCITCGAYEPVVRLHPIKIKRIPGGNAIGMALISANEETFLSFGQEASDMAPMCMHCSWLLGNGLNQLISGEITHVTVGSVVYCFWAKHAAAITFCGPVIMPDPHLIRQLFFAAATGEVAYADTEDLDRFYTMAVTANNARVVVREWQDIPFRRVRASVQDYFMTQRIVNQRGEDHFFGVHELAKSVVSTKATKQVPAPQVVTALLRTAFLGKPLPLTMLSLVLARLRANDGVTDARIALVKLVLGHPQQRHIRHEDAEVLTMAQLDTTNDDPGYVCGRLFAHLAKIQYHAQGDIGATIVDRFYSAVSATPAYVMPTLIRGARNHLAKIRRQQVGLAVNLEKQLNDIVILLDGKAGIPKTLSMVEQGFFAVGYHHQRTQGFTTTPSVIAPITTSGEQAS